MSLSNNGENQVLDEIFNAGGGTFPAADPYISLHTADPGETGANEASGGSYARQQAPFGAAASGTLSNTGNIDFASMPAATIVAWAVWDAVSAGNCFWTGWFSTVGRIGIHHTETADDNIYSPDHGLVNDDRVVMEQIEGETMPGGLTAGTIYWVTGTPGQDDFQLSTTQDGGAVDITSDGGAMFRLVVPKTTNSGDTLRIGTGELDLFID